MNATIVANALSAHGGLVIAPDPRVVNHGMVYVTDEGARCVAPTMRLDKTIGDGDYASTEVTVLCRLNARTEAPTTSAGAYVARAIIGPLLTAGAPVSSWTWERVTNDTVTHDGISGATSDRPLLRVRIGMDVGA